MDSVDQDLLTSALQALGVEDHGPIGALGGKRRFGIFARTITTWC
jgi:hypothetical protein